MLRSEIDYFKEICDEFADIDTDILEEIVGSVLQAVKNDLNENYYAAYHVSSCEKKLDCGCVLSLELSELDEISPIHLQTPSLDIEYCEEHSSKAEFEEECRRIAFELWRNDPEAIYDWKNRQLFSIAGL